MRVETTDRDRRLAAAGLALVAAAHLLAPGLLLRAARAGYGLALDVRFEPRAGARRRVRLLGLAFGVAALVASAAVSGDSNTARPSTDQ
jgi:hypothetical protein